MSCSYSLGELCTFSRGASVPRARMYVQGDYIYIHYGDLYKGFSLRVDVDSPQKKLPFILKSEKIREGQYLHDQDIVYVLTSETIDDLGHSFLFNNPKGLPAVAGTETTIMHITRRDLVIPAYINYLLQTEYFKKLLRQYVKGMKVFRVHPDDIAHIVVDLPTLGEQAKMVSLLDVLFEQQLILSRTNGYLAA